MTLLQSELLLDDGTIDLPILKSLSEAATFHEVTRMRPVKASLRSGRLFLVVVGSTPGRCGEHSWSLW